MDQLKPASIDLGYAFGRRIAGKDDGRDIGIAGLIPIRKNWVVRHVDEIALIGMSSNWGAGHLFSTGDVL